MESAFFEIIKSGGSLGAVALMVFYLVKKDKFQQQKDEMFNDTLSKHFDRNTIAYEKMSETQEKTMQTLERLSLRIEGCPHNKFNKR